MNRFMSGEIGCFGRNIHNCLGHIVFSVTQNNRNAFKQYQYTGVLLRTPLLYKP